MEIIGMICIVIGLLIGLVFGVQLLVMAFKTSVLWGLGFLFIPLVGLIFVIQHWDETKTPFLRSLLCIPFYIIGALMSGGAHEPPV